MNEVIIIIAKSLKEVIDKEISPQLTTIQEAIDRIEAKIDVLYDQISTVERL